jgi:BirA family biotin operon repressor/biotin-[acetyl-CoA-carboxylase] ligase
MDFNAENLNAALSGKAIGSPLYFFPSADSTNLLAFKLAGEGAPEGTAIIADHQTCGRGRMQRVWQSPPAVNLYTSLILRPALAAALSSPLTIMAGVAVAELLNGYADRFQIYSQVRLKWPNDVLINDKKVSGILTEMKTAGNKVEFVIIGIGININMQKNDFSPPLEEIATSLRIEMGKTIDRVGLTVKLFEIMADLYQLFLREGIKPIRELWLSSSQLMERCVGVTFGEEVYQGMITGMDDAGALIIRDGNGEQRRVIAGDVKLMEG